MLRSRRPLPGHLGLLVEQLPGSFVWTTDVSLRLTSVAGAALSMLGIVGVDEFVGRDVAAVIGPSVDRTDEILDAHRRALGGQTATFTQPWKQWAFDVHVEPLREGEKVVGVGGIALDASKRLIAERALAESEARFRTLVERLPALVTYVNSLDFPLRTTYVSPQIESLVGYPAERWLTEEDFWLGVIHPDDRERVVEAAKRTRERGEAFREAYRLVAADGRVVHVRDETQRVSGERGEPLFLQGFLLETGAA